LRGDAAGLGFMTPAASLPEQTGGVVEMTSKKTFLFVLVAALATVCAQRAAAQTGSVPVGKIAVIFSEAFQDPKQGITKFTVIQNQLNTEFKKPQEELDAAAQKVQSLADEITRLQKSVAPVDPKSTQAKIDQLEQLKKDSQRKLEDTQALYKNRRTVLLMPLQEDVGKALDAFAKAHGITLIIDGSQVPGVIYAADTMDVTRVFIAEYNTKNPATAATATVKP
jgi:Skp family chaperone for outer membrane proteins